jgi:hypothetical protein
VAVTAPDWSSSDGDVAAGRDGSRPPGGISPWPEVDEAVVAELAADAEAADAEAAEALRRELIESGRADTPTIGPDDPVLVATTIVELMGTEALRLELADHLGVTLGLLLPHHDPPRFDMVARELRAAADMAETDPELALRRLIDRTREQLLARCADCEDEAA